MNKICTSLEQSKKLIELGIDVKTADMYYDVNSYGIQGKPEVVVGEVWSKDIPAWSLSALLDLPPKCEDNNIDLCFGGYKGEEYIDEWFCTFEDNKEPFEFHSYSNKDKLDAVFEMICWLKENNKI